MGNISLNFALMMRLQLEIAETLKLANNKVDLSKIELLKHNGGSRSILTYEGKRLGEFFEFENDFKFYPDKAIYPGSNRSSTIGLIP